MQLQLYMIIDFVQGGDFFTLMRKFRRMKEEWVQVYIAEIHWHCSTCMTWISCIGTSR